MIAIVGKNDLKNQNEIWFCMVITDAIQKGEDSTPLKSFPNSMWFDSRDPSNIPNRYVIFF